MVASLPSRSEYALPMSNVVVVGEDGERVGAHLHLERDRADVLHHGRSGLLGLDCVRRVDQDQVRKVAKTSPALDRGVGDPHFTPDTLAGEELHVEAVHQDALPDLVIGPAHAGEQEVVGHRHVAFGGQTGRDTRGVLLGDAALDHAVEHVVHEPLDLGELHVLEDRDGLGVVEESLLDGFADPLARHRGRADRHILIPRCHIWLSLPRHPSSSRHRGRGACGALPSWRPRAP